VRKILVALAIASLLSVAVVASASGSTGSASSASPTPQASAAPPKLGFYAGIECSHWSCDYWSRAREGMRVHCGSLMHVSGYPSGVYSSDVDGHNIVCFRLTASNSLDDFHVAGYKIVRHVYVSSDRFPETCDNGWCIQGEWFSTTSEQGRFRNPNSVYADYKAEWFSS